MGTEGRNSDGNETQNRPTAPAGRHRKTTTVSGHGACRARGQLMIKKNRATEGARTTENGRRKPRDEWGGGPLRGTRGSLHRAQKCWGRASVERCGPWAETCKQWGEQILVTESCPESLRGKSLRGGETSRKTRPTSTSWGEGSSTFCPPGPRGTGSCSCT